MKTMLNRAMKPIGGLFLCAALTVGAANAQQFGFQGIRPSSSALFANDPFKQRLEAMGREVEGLLRSSGIQMPINVFDMADGGQRGFAQERFTRYEGDEAVGWHSLSAGLDSGSIVDGRNIKTCIVIYNAQRKDVLEKGLMVLDDEGSVGASSLFLMAHEAGHCLDRLFNDRASGSDPLWGEFGADAFAAIAVMAKTGRSDIILRIIAHRGATVGSHATAPALKKTIRAFDLGHLAEMKSAKDMWALAARIRAEAWAEQALQTRK